jgi:hypothetical protein
MRIDLAQIEAFNNFYNPLIQKLDRIIMSQDLATIALNAATAQLQAIGVVVGKTSTETQNLLDQIVALTAAVATAGQAVTPELQAALDGLVAQVPIVQAAVDAQDALVVDAAAPVVADPVADPAP